MRPVTLITGASAGIGTALAHVFARNGHELVLVARREERLGRSPTTLPRRGGRPMVLAADLARPTPLARIGEALAARARARHVVNNAGFGLVGRPPSSTAPSSSP